MKLNILLTISLILLLLISKIESSEESEQSTNNNSTTEQNETTPQTGKFEKLNETVILTKENLQEALETFSPLLVLFYSNTRDSKRMY